MPGRPELSILLSRALFVWVLAFTGAARAQAPAVSVAGDPVDATAMAIDLGATYRLSATGLSRLRVDVDGDGQAATTADGRPESYGQDYLLAHRLSVMPRLKAGKAVTFYGDLQLAAGYLALKSPEPRFADFGPPRGDDALGYDARQIALRKLYLEWRTLGGALMAGRMASEWGLGILANSGDRDLAEWGTTHFGSDYNFGDVVDRVLLATAPLLHLIDAPWASRLVLAVGADVVVRDERIDRAQGDIAGEAIGVLRYAHKGNEAGVYAAYRDLRDRYHDTLNVTALDVYGRGSFRMGDFDLTATGELAWVTGDTTWGRSAGCTGSLDVAQLGYVARAGATYKPLALGGDVELGYASGDTNPFDCNLRNFTFDPDYNPSLILFEELRAAETVAAQANVSDPARVGVPPDSARLLPTGGAVSNAIYLRPTVRYRFGDLGAKLSVLWARAEENVVDPYNTTLLSAGGDRPLSYQGGIGARKDLGIEVNVGVDYTYTLAGGGNPLELKLALQAGQLNPGSAFDNGQGQAHPNVSVVFAQLTARWLPPESPAN